jgi:hypothetical protein
MYIFPDGRIYCLQNVPLNPNSEDTFLFTGANDTEAYNNQFNYFYSKRNSSLDMLAQSYTRVDDGVIRAPGKADDYYAVNYIMFQNHAHGNKWFYAFITKIEYVNEGTTRLHFTIDPIQTYLYNYHTTECFVERMSTPTDGIGEWMAPENVTLGEHVTNGHFKYLGGSFYDKRIIVMYVDPTQNGGSVYDNTFCAAKLYAYDPFDSNDINALNTFIDQHVHDAIIGMYMTPAELVRNTKGGNIVVGYDDGYTATDTDNAINANTTLDGYLPENKKLLTFPYNYYRVRNGVGNEMCVRYEFFTNKTPSFSISGSTLPPVEMQIYPINYKNSSVGYRTSRLSCADFPMCSWSQDAYSAWWALNSNSYQIENQKVFASIGGKTTAGLGGAIAGALAGGPLGGLIGSVSGVNTLINGVTSAYERTMDNLALEAKLNDSADITTGTYNSGNVNYVSGGNCFIGERMSINGNMALKIDKYFTAYGYAIGYMRHPDRNNRSRFTYVKTVACNVYGDLPVDDAINIAKMYDRGIRFWKDTANFCNYSLGNPI